VDLCVPLKIEFEEWERWKQESIAIEKPYTDYPFLRNIVSRIDQSLQISPGTCIDLGPIACPYCANELSVKGEFSPTCLECGSKIAGRQGAGIASLRFGVVWPPIA
jgi:hypothetical protein